MPHPPLAATLVVCLVAALVATGCSNPDPPTLSLYRAVYDGNINQLQRHIAAGSDLDARDPDGNTPLHVAALQGQIVMVEMLIEHGAAIDARNSGNATPLELALTKGRTQLAEVLLRGGATFDPDAMLHEMVTEQVADRDVYRFLMKHRANIDARDAAGNTPLHRAAQLGYRLTAKQLIANGADINARNPEGATPLALAVAAGQGETAQLLRLQGAEP